MRKEHDASSSAIVGGGWKKHLRPFSKRVIHKSVRTNVKRKLHTGIDGEFSDGKDDNSSSEAGERTY